MSKIRRDAKIILHILKHITWYILFSYVIDVGLTIVLWPILSAYGYYSSEMRH